jgi:hypothetical protein
LPISLFTGTAEIRVQFSQTPGLLYAMLSNTLLENSRHTRTRQ